MRDIPLVFTTHRIVGSQAKIEKSTQIQSIRPCGHGQHAAELSLLWGASLVCLDTLVLDLKGPRVRCLNFPMFNWNENGVRKSGTSSSIELQI